MRILITGATGFLGSAVCPPLVRAGHEVFAIVRSGTSPTAALDGVSLVEQDLATLHPDALPDRIEALLTLAQYRNFTQFPERAPDVLDVNLTAHHRLFTWSAMHGVSRIVHVSSGGIYGGRRNHRFVESEPLRIDAPLGIYLASKACTEFVLHSYRAVVPHITVLRPFFIYGPGMPADRLIARLAGNIRHGEPITLDGEDGLMLNPIFVDDAVHGVFASLALDGHHCVNLGGGDTRSLRSMCEMIAQHVGRPATFRQREQEPLDYVGDITLSTSLWGAPSVSLEDGLARTVAELCGVAASAS